MSTPTTVAPVRGAPRRALSLLFAILLVAAMVIAPGLMKTNSASALDTDDWELPANTELDSYAIIQSGISFVQKTGPDTFEMGLTYRTAASPLKDWIYVRIDSELAPYVEEMSVKGRGGAALYYTRYFEKVQPGMGNDVKASGELKGPEDPYAQDGNVWRVLNDRKNASNPCLINADNYTRRTLCGNWGVFNNVSLQNQQQTGVVNVKLNKPIEQIIAETGRDTFIANSRWQSNPSEPGGVVKINSFAEATGAVIFLGENPDLPGVIKNDTWLTAQTFHKMFYEYEGEMMGPEKAPVASPEGSSVLRAVQVQPHRVASYNTAVGATKPYSLHYKLQPEVVDALEGDAVIWQAYRQSKLGRAGGIPVTVPKESFTPDGQITITTDQTKVGQNGFVVVPEVGHFLNRQASEPVNSATIIDLPLDEDKLIPDRNDPNYFKQIHIANWFTDAEDRMIQFSFANSFFNMHVSEAPTVTNIAVGNASGSDELTTKNEVRQTQNFIQGTALAGSNVTVLKVTGLDTAAEKREVIAKAKADDQGNWSTKLCHTPQAYDDNGDPVATDECTSKYFEDHGITAGGDAKLIVIARQELQAASKDVLVNVTDVQTNDPVVDYTAEAPLARDATVIEGKIGPQHQNSNSTVVTAYIKAPADQPTTRQANNDGLTEIGSTSPIAGDTTGGQPFSIPVTAAQLESCPDIVLKAVESTHPKNPAATMPTAKDDAYSPSNEVKVPVCEQVTVTFDLNGGTLAEPIAPVSVTKGDALGADFPAATPVKDGFTFKGWATTPGATTADFDATTVVNADTTVYAAWSTEAIDWGNENGDVDGNLITIPTTYDYGQQLTQADYKALIQNNEKLPADAVVSVSPAINTTPADAAGRNQTVDVTVTFGDGSTLTAPVDITIRPAADSYDPVAEAIDVEKGEQPSATAVENAVTDANGKAFPDGTTIALKEPVDTTTVGPTTGTVVVTYPDGSTDEITIPINVVDTSDAATYQPTTDTITVPYGGELPALDTAVNNKAELPAGTTYEDVTTPAIDTTKPGTYTGQLKVNYPDASTETVPVTVIVQTAADSFDPQAAPVDVNLNEQPTAEQLLAATTLDGTTPLPEGSSVAVVGALDTSAPGPIANVPLLVTYPDGTTDNITTTVNVIDNRTDAEKFPATPVVQPVDVPYGGTFNPEDGIANTADLPMGTTYTDVTNEGVGVDTTVPGATTAQVEVSYPDGSKAVVDVPVNVLTAAETFDPAASDITVEINTDPTQDQIDAAVTDTQGREFPAGTTFALTKGVDTSTEGTKVGEITVTYPDNSSEVVTVNIIVEDNRTDAEKFPAEPVAQPVEVPYGGTFNPEDGIANLVDLPAGTTVADITAPAIDTTAPGDYIAKVEVTYPDGSKAVVDVPVKVKTAAETFDPVGQQAVVELGGTVNPNDTIANLADLPAGTTVTIAPEVDTSVEGVTDVIATVTYPDGSSEQVPASVKVVDNRTDAEKFPATPVTQPVEVELNEPFNPADGIANVTDLPAGTTFTDVTNGEQGLDTSVEGDFIAKVQVGYPDGSSVTVDVPVKVVDSRTDAEKFPAEPVAQPVEVPYGGTFNPEDGIANLADLPAGTTVADITAPAIDTTAPGDYIAKVEVTYPDGSKAVVDVPVKVKTAAETFNPIPAPVEVEQGGTVNPDDTIANLDELPAGTTVTLPEDFNTDEVGTKVVDVTVTYPDGSSETVQVEITVTEPTPTDAEKYTPVGQQAVVELGGTVNPNDTIANLADLPAGTTVTIAPEVDTSVEGVTDVIATVTYPDGSSEQVPASVKVVDNRPDNVKYDPVAEVITVEKDAQPTQEQLNNAVSDKGGKAFPDGTTIALKAPVDTSTVGETTGTVVVTYPDGTADEVAVTINVVDTSDAATYEPQVTPIEVGYGETLPALDTAITNKAELPEGTTYEDVTETPIDTTKPGEYVGKVKVIYPDGSSEVVNVPVTVKDTRTDAEKYTPIPAPVEVEQGGTVNPDDTIANLDELPAGTTVTLPEDFNTDEVGTKVVDVTVTYPDGSSETVQVEITVTEPAGTETDADKYTPIPNPVEVEQGGTVNPDDTIANLDELPAGTTVTLPEDFNTDEVGTKVVDVTVTYPDGSSETVQVEITVTEPADTTTDADKYEPIPAPVEVEVGGKVNPDDTIENLDELPEGTTVTVPDIDTTKPGKVVVDVTVTYPDGSEDTVEVEVTIVDPNDGKTDADKYEPIPAPVEVEVGGKVNPDDTIENLDELPEGTTVTVPDIDTTKPGKVVVDVTVTYPDGSEDTVEVEVTIVDPNDGKTDADKYEPKPKPVEVEVGDKVNPEDTIENLDELPEGTIVEMDPIDTTKPGTHVVEVTVTYPDGSTDTFTTTVTVKDPVKPAPKPSKPGYGNDIPFTGADTIGLGIASALAIIGGIAAVAFARRRKDS